MEQELKARLELSLRELRRRVRTHNKSGIDFRDYDFPRQLQAMGDDSKMKAYNTTRRGAKSTTVVKEILQEMWDFPKTKHIYFALTKDSAQSIAWDIFIEELESKMINYKANEHLGRISLENGSSMRFMGVDANYKEMKKALGQKLYSVNIDEAGSMTIDMEKLIYQMTRPALIDLNGKLRVFGTCENIPNTFFEKITEGKLGGWSVHKWTTLENPYMRDKWIAEIADLKKNNPLIEQASWFKTHYLNQWVHDDELLIYRVTDINMVDRFNSVHLENYILSIDLGYNDSSSFTIQADNRSTNKVIYLKSFKSSEMTLDEVAQTTRNLQKDFAFSKIIIDGANKQGVETMRARYGIPFLNADKTEKMFHIRQLRDDFKLGNVQIHKEDCNDLILECSHLQFKNKQFDEEDPRCQNHCTDGMLYAYRQSRFFVERELDIEKIDTRSAEYMDNHEQMEMEAYECRKSAW